MVVGSNCLMENVAFEKTVEVDMLCLIEVQKNAVHENYMVEEVEGNVALNHCSFVVTVRTLFVSI